MSIFKLQRRSKSQRIVFSIFWVLMIALASTYLFIYIWSFFAGLKTHDDLVMRPFKFTPAQWRNYIDVFSLLRVSKTGFIGMLFNSIYFSVGNAFFMCMCSCQLAYVTSKFKYKILQLFLPITMVVITMPIYGTAGVRYKLYHDLGFLDSYTQILGATNGFNIFFLYFCAAFNSLTDATAEAARIDGAGEYTIFYNIMLPQVIGLFGALFVTNWIACWNDYSTPLIYLRRLPTLASGIYQFELNMIFEVRMDILFAAYTIASIPPIIIFACFNKILTNNVSLGAVKD